MSILITDYGAVKRSQRGANPAGNEVLELVPSVAISQQSIVTPYELNLQRINNKIAILKISIPEIGDVLLAITRDSMDNPRPLVTPDWSKVTDPKDLKPFLNSNASYGGTRLAKPDEGLKKAIESLLILAYYESDSKHSILNALIGDDALKGLIDKDGNLAFNLDAPAGSGMRDIKKGYEVPKDFFKLKFNGGRCVIFPKDQSVYDKLLARDSELYDRTFQVVGGFLNGKLEAEEINISGEKTGERKIPPGSLFLTPDYGSNAEVADILYKYTPHVLGVSPLRGGGGGKSSYTVSFLKGAFNSYLNVNPTLSHIDTPITLIGSAGAIGNGFAKYISESGWRNVRVADLRFNENRVEVSENTKKVYFKDPIINSDGSITEYQEIPPDWEIVKAEAGKFSDDALKGEKPGIYVMTTVGHELENSNHSLIPAGSVVFLAHNFSMPTGFSQELIIEELLSKPVDLLTGVQLTPGGALYSRLEITHRASQGISYNSTNIPPFPKVLMHKVGENLGFRLTEETFAPIVIEKFRTLIAKTPKEEIRLEILRQVSAELGFQLTVDAIDPTVGNQIENLVAKEIVRQTLTRMGTGTSFINHVLKRMDTSFDGFTSSTNGRLYVPGKEEVAL